MKKILCLLAFSHTIFAQYVEDTWKQVSEKKSGSIAVAYVQTPGFVYTDKDGKLTGICVDIMGDFVDWVKENKKIDLQVKYVGDGTNFRGMYDKVKVSKGGVFGLGNITITKERAKEVKFSPPFITNIAILISPVETPTLNKFEDLSTKFEGLTAYAAKGTLNEKRILDLKQKYYPAMVITSTATSQETATKVFTDPKGFAYLDLAFYLEALKLKKSVKRHPVGDITGEQFGFAMPLNSDWFPVVDAFFKANGGYTNSSSYKQILMRHMGEAGLKFMKSIGK